jgi:hypothetical protein
VGLLHYHMGSAPPLHPIYAQLNGKGTANFETVDRALWGGYLASLVSEAARTDGRRALPTMNLKALFEDFYLSYLSVLLLIFLFVVVGVTQYYVFYADSPERDFMALLRPSDVTAITVYSGSSTGSFDQMARKLRSRHKVQRTFRSDDLTLVVEQTGGSHDNIQSVSLSAHAIGFAGENALKSKTSEMRNVRTIAPTHLEKLQVLYRKDRWKEITSNCPTPRKGGSCIPPQRPFITRPLDPFTLALLRGSAVHVGPPGSATRLIAAELLAQARLSEADGVGAQLVFGSFEDQHQRLAAEGADSSRVTVGVALAGPLSRAEELVKEGKCGFAAVDPALAASLRADEDIALQPTVISEAGKNEVETLGNFAWLIASEDVPDSHLSAILAGLDTPQWPHEANATAQENATHGNRQHVIKTLKERARAGEFTLVSAFIRILLTTVTVSTILFWWLGWLWSHFGTARRYMRRYEEERKKFDDKQWPPDKCEEALRQTVKQLEEVQKLIMSMERAFAVGGLFGRHRAALVELFGQLSAKMRRACRLHHREWKRRDPERAMSDEVYLWIQAGHLEEGEASTVAAKAGSSSSPGSAPA